MGSTARHDFLFGCMPAKRPRASRVRNGERRTGRNSLSWELERIELHPAARRQPANAKPAPCPRGQPQRRNAFKYRATSTEISVVLPPEKASKPHDQPIIRMPKLRGRAAGGIRWVLPHSDFLSKCGCPDNLSPNPLPVQAILWSEVSRERGSIPRATLRIHDELH